MKKLKERINTYNYHRHLRGIIKNQLGKLVDGVYVNAKPEDYVYLKATAHQILMDANDNDELESARNYVLCSHYLLLYDSIVSEDEDERKMYKKLADIKLELSKNDEELMETYVLEDEE